MRRALLAQYSNSARDYAYMVHQLSERVAYPDRIQYLNLHKATEEARIHAEAARLEYERHLAQHGCFHGTRFRLTEGPDSASAAIARCSAITQHLSWSVKRNSGNFTHSAVRFPLHLHS